MVWAVIGYRESEMSHLFNVVWGTRKVGKRKADCSQHSFLKVGPIGCPKTSVTINQCCVTCQKNKALIYTMMKA